MEKDKINSRLKEELEDALCRHCECTDYGTVKINTGPLNLCEGCRCNEALEGWKESNSTQYVEMVQHIYEDELEKSSKKLEQLISQVETLREMVRSVDVEVPTGHEFAVPQQSILNFIDKEILKK
jgi:NMD protein affecting ribosome stability and mRNA decay